MKKSKTPRYVTPAGIAQYPYLTKPDTKFNPDGEYKLSLQVPTEESTSLIAFLDEQLAESIAKAKKENPGKKIKEGTAGYEVDEETGNTTFRFKLKAKVNMKSGDSFEQRPALFDSKGKPLDSSVNIAGGSKVKVSYEILPYYTAIAGAGLSLRVRAVQVIDLVEFSGGGAGAFGFGEEEGYVANDKVNNDFSEETSEEDETADF